MCAVAVAGAPAAILTNALGSRVCGVDARVCLDEGGLPWIQVRGATRR